MPLNLLQDQWISVTRRSGAHQLIAPWEIGDTADPPIAVRSPRPDFDGALVQFLIGVLQTLAPPADEDEWLDRLDTPLEPSELRTKLDSWANAFNLDGDGVRFMQDKELGEGEDKPVGQLLIETPGGRTLRENLDHFVKRGRVDRLCDRCAATALLTMQINAPSGGVGHRTSLRGGGPLTTLVRGNTLWETIAMNLLDTREMAKLNVNNIEARQESVLPWVVATRTSEAKTGVETTPSDVHPLQMYWCMPRRISLCEHSENGPCDVCGSKVSHFFTSYVTKNYGTNYTGPWLHPLSPHGHDKKGMPFCRHPNPGGITYRHWLGLVVADDLNAPENRPAAVVHRYMREFPREQCRLWAFGYDMDNMKPRCWYESTMPLFGVPRKQQQDFATISGRYVKAASQIASNLRSSLKAAWFKRPGDKKGDTSFAETALWQRTEDAFYTNLRRLRDVLQENDPMKQTSLAQEWHRAVHRTAMGLFEEHCLYSPIEDSNPARIALARRDLIRWNHSKKITNKMLQLPAKADKPK